MCFEIFAKVDLPTSCLYPRGKKTVCFVPITTSLSFQTSARKTHITPLFEVALSSPPSPPIDHIASWTSGGQLCLTTKTRRLDPASRRKLRNCPPAHTVEYWDPSSTELDQKTQTTHPPKKKPTAHLFFSQIASSRTSNLLSPAMAPASEAPALAQEDNNSAEEAAVNSP